jgi:formylglycine-generating enzyme required for sulfatase activity
MMRWIEPQQDTDAGFWIADTPCTQALWFAVMGNNPAEFQGDLQRPVERVSWSAVQGFLRQLNLQVEGLQARLPTEAEWERACRAGTGTTTAYVFGDSVTQEQVHFSAQATVAVKALAADKQGLYGMHGNVWEWCQDDFDALGDLKVLRGGSWASDAVQCRSDARGRNHAGNRDYTVGFRFVVC